MRIEDRLIKLALERKAIINKVAQVKHELQQIPQTKHIKMEFSTVKVNELSVEEQSSIIRFQHKSR